MSTGTPLQRSRCQENLKLRCSWQKLESGSHVPIALIVKLMNRCISRHAAGDTLCSDIMPPCYIEVAGSKHNTFSWPSVAFLAQSCVLYQQDQTLFAVQLVVQSPVFNLRCSIWYSAIASSWPIRHMLNSMHKLQQSLFELVIQCLCITISTYDTLCKKHWIQPARSA